MYRSKKAAFIPSAIFVLALGLGACSPKAVEAPADDMAAATPPPLTEPAPASDHPAMWTATDEDTTVYLFGTVHILKPDTEWRSDEFDAAFASADAVYFEADTTSPEVQQSMQAHVMEGGFYHDGRTLTEVLDADDEKEVAEAAEILGFTLTALDPMKPWFAAINLTVTQLIKEGYDVKSGVEIVLSAEAESAGTPLRYFETAEQQINFFINMSEEDQIASLVASAELIDDNPHLLDELVDDWIHADVAGIAEVMTDEDSLGSKAIYETLIVDRNTEWVGQIKTLMDDEPGTFFIAVGAGHLAGPDSVIAQLRADDIAVSGP